MALWTSWTDELELAEDVSWPLWRFKGIDGNPPIDFCELKKKLNLHGFGHEVLTIFREDKTAPSQYAKR